MRCFGYSTTDAGKFETSYPHFRSTVPESVLNTIASECSTSVSMVKPVEGTVGNNGRCGAEENARGCSHE